MFYSPPPSQYVYQISDEAQIAVLQNQFELFYHKLAESKVFSHATFETVKGLQRVFSGMPHLHHNIVIGCPEKEADFDSIIEEQLEYFNEQEVPFIWYVNEDDSPLFKEKLKENGFKDCGILQGLIGPLDQPITSISLPEDCVLERVKDAAAMEEFNDLVSKVFGFEGAGKLAYKTCMWTAATGKNPVMYHWIARKKGKVISALTTLIHDGVISFWNGSTLPEYRKQGYSTALRRLALQYAIEKKGARMGSSYIMTDGPAFGICTKLGYKTKWRFHAFSCPSASTGN